jgi:hypothetical protein
MSEEVPALPQMQCGIGDSAREFMRHLGSRSWSSRPAHTSTRGRSDPRARIPMAGSWPGTPRPRPTILDWVSDVGELLDLLAIDRFAAMGWFPAGLFPSPGVRHGCGGSERDRLAVGIGPVTTSLRSHRARVPPETSRYAPEGEARRVLT